MERVMRYFNAKYCLLFLVLIYAIGCYGEPRQLGAKVGTSLSEFVWRSQSYSSSESTWLRTNFYSTNDLKYDGFALITYYVKDPKLTSESARHAVINSIKLARQRFGVGYAEKQIQAGRSNSEFDPHHVHVMIVNMAFKNMGNREKSYPVGVLFTADEFFNAELEDLEKSMKLEPDPFRFDVTEEEEKHGYSPREKEVYPILDRYLQSAESNTD
jgi:hypothetical protein